MWLCRQLLSSTDYSCLQDRACSSTGLSSTWQLACIVMPVISALISNNLLFSYSATSRKCEIKLSVSCPIHTADADATQLSSWVVSASRRRRRCVLNSQLAHDDCRRLPTEVWKLNMLRIYPVELSRVELCRWCVHTRRLSWPSLQFCSLYVTGAENWKLGHDWRLVRTHCRHEATRLRCRQIVQTRHDSSRLSPTSCEFNSTRELSRVGVGGVYWALEEELFSMQTSVK